MHNIMMKTIKDLSFCRNAGTEEEQKAFNYLKEHLDSYNISWKFQKFPVTSYEPWNSSVKYHSKTMEIFPLGLTGQTPPEGLFAPLEYIFHGQDSLITDNVNGKIVLSYGSVSVEKFELLKKKGCVAYLRILNPGSDLMHINVASECIERFGELPGAVIGFEDARTLLRDQPETIQLNIFQKIFQSETGNLVAEIPGIRYEDEIIVIGAHLDTVPELSGVQDNLTGSAALLELAVSLKKNRPLRTVRIVWFSGEELGMYGSRHYVKVCEDHLSDHKLMINLDAFGGQIGKPKIRVMGPDNLLEYAKILDKIFGGEFSINKSLYTSDNIAFYPRKIPTISFGQENGTSDLMHTLKDAPGILDESCINRTMEYVNRIVSDMTNAHKIPFKHEEDEELMKETKDYFRKWLGSDEIENL